MQCGLDLSRTRPRRDSRLALPIVICPECRWAIVRRRHPLATTWRASRRVTRAAAIVLLQLLLTCFFAAVVVSRSRQLSDVIRANESTLVASLLASYTIDTTGGSPDTRQISVAAATIWLAVSVLTGAWLGAAFAHWRPRGAPLLAWIGVLVLFSAGDSLRRLLDALVFAIAARPIPQLVQPLAGWSMTAQTLAASVILTLTAIPLGSRIRAVWRVAQRSFLRNKLFKARLMRSGR